MWRQGGVDLPSRFHLLSILDRTSGSTYSRQIMKKRLITSALPYVNNIPHLGNLIQVLSADVFARFCRLKGYETMYVCGTDEYGTATETKALEEGITPKELCDRYYTVHSEIYSWFNIAFNNFGRTSTREQTEIVQHIFRKLDENGFIKEKTDEQLYCISCEMFLADRYVRGTCPHCNSSDARGDQCENCGKLLDPTELIEPGCGTCGNTPEVRETNHLYIDLPAILPRLQEWMEESSVRGHWARNAVQMTQAWIRDGLHERCITRDLKWGIPVPKDGYRDKVFYVWFDAPIGYISITASLTGEWEKWWKNPEEVELFQFIGKDNIPFHTVIFPCSLLGTGEPWTLLHHMSSSEYLNYGDGKFSKSKGVGVFGNDVRDTGIPADVWRFYIYYNRPEKSDAVFTWDDFQTRVNSELIGNLSNLVNRTLTFVHRFFDGKVPGIDGSSRFWKEVRKQEERITEHFEKAELKEALKAILALSSYGNKAFQDGEPWKTRKTEPKKAEALLHDLVYLIRDLAVLTAPFIPETAGRISRFLHVSHISWDALGKDEGLPAIEKPEILFELLEDDQILSLRKRFSGTQQERIMEQEEKAQQKLSAEEQFRQSIDLRVAKIIGISRHPEADKLYIETISLGNEERQIVSGLVPYYSEEDLLGKNIILVYNLKPAKLRGEKSEGMLLAAEKQDEHGESFVEVLFADHAEPGTPVLLEGDAGAGEEKKRIKIEKFFEIPLTVRDHTVYAGSTALTAGGCSIRTKDVDNGDVG